MSALPYTHSPVRVSLEHAESAREDAGEKREKSIVCDIDSIPLNEGLDEVEADCIESTALDVRAGGYQGALAENETIKRLFQHGLGEWKDDRTKLETRN